MGRLLFSSTQWYWTQKVPPVNNQEVRMKQTSMFHELIIRAG